MRSESADRGDNPTASVWASTGYMAIKIKLTSRRKRCGPKGLRRPFSSEDKLHSMGMGLRVFIIRVPPNEGGCILPVACLRRPGEARGLAFVDSSVPNMRSEGDARGRPPQFARACRLLRLCASIFSEMRPRSVGERSAGLLDVEALSDMDESNDISTSGGSSMLVRVGEGAGEGEGSRETPRASGRGEEGKQSMLSRWNSLGRRE